MKQGKNRNKFRVDIRRIEAAGRAEGYSQLTPQQKLAKLDSTLGVGVGAQKQRARLQQQIQDGVKPPKPDAVRGAFGATKG